MDGRVVKAAEASNVKAVDKEFGKGGLELIGDVIAAVAVQAFGVL